MKHLQLYESYQQLPEGVSEIPYHVYATWAEKTEGFSDGEEETLQLLASLAEAKGSQGYHVVTYTKKGGGKAVSFRKIINDRYALTTVKTTYPTDFRYYSSASLDKLLPLAIDYLDWREEWIEIR